MSPDHPTEGVERLETAKTYRRSNESLAEARGPRDSDASFTLRDLVEEDQLDGPETFTYADIWLVLQPSGKTVHVIPRERTRGLDSFEVGEFDDVFELISYVEEIEVAWELMTEEQRVEHGGKELTTDEEKVEENPERYALNPAGA